MESVLDLRPSLTSRATVSKNLFPKMPSSEDEKCAARTASTSLRGSLIPTARKRYGFFRLKSFLILSFSNEANLRL